MDAVNTQEIDVLITSAGITIFQAASVAYTDKQHSINVTTINVTTINQISVKVYGGTFSFEKKQHVIAIDQHAYMKHNMRISSMKLVLSPCIYHVFQS
jgi:short-subunit dehydrogenase